MSDNLLIIILALVLIPAIVYAIGFWFGKGLMLAKRNFIRRELNKYKEGGN